MNNSVVVDASIALKWVLEEADSGTADALLDNWHQRKLIVFAPALLMYEIANILYQKTRKGQITIEEANKALKEVLGLGILFDFSPKADISLRALVLANNFKLSATYDTHYLALAEQKSAELWTADTRMWNAVKEKLNWVRNISEYQPS